MAGYLEIAIKCVTYAQPNHLPLKIDLIIPVKYVLVLLAISLLWFLKENLKFKSYLMHTFVSY